MITINIEPADNGVVKFLLDDNINGGGEEHVARRVYDFECRVAFIASFLSKCAWCIF